MKVIPLFISALLSISIVACANTTDMNGSNSNSKPSYKTEMSLCYNDEVPIVSCQIDDNKQSIISICSKQNDQLVFYRYGKQNHYELETVFSETNPLIRTVTHSNYSTYFQFQNAGYQYTVVIPEEDYGVKTYIDIVTPNDKVFSKSCITNSLENENYMSPAIVDIEESEFDFP